MLLCVTVSVALMAVYLIFRDAILTMFGGRVNEKTFVQAQEYFFWIALGIPFYMFGQALNPIIRSDGSPQFAMVSTRAGAAVNIVLDPVFIFVFRWGMMGAAVGIVMKLFQIVISIAVGLAVGCIPVVGYNIGAVIIAQTYRFLGATPQGKTKNL